MYSRVIRNILKASAKFPKQTINDSTKLFVPTSLAVPKLLASSYQCSVQHYSTIKESVDKRLTDDLQDDSSNDEYSSSESDEADNIRRASIANKFKSQFDQKEQAKLDDLLKDNPDMQRLKKIIEMELIVLQQDGECVPSSLLPRHWVEVLQMKSKSQRRKFYKFLFINEKLNEKRKKEQEEKQLQLQKVREERKKAQPTNGIVYGFADNFMLRRISEAQMRIAWQQNSLNALMYGNKLVFDCSYEQYMTSLELKSCAKQINESYSVNRAHDFPFEIFLTNVNMSGRLIEQLHRFIPILFEKDFPFHITEKSYLELFEQSKLCYLTSNAPNMLEKYDADTIYIIGAYVDKGSKQPVSFGRAKREHLRMAKLPLDRYLEFGSGSGKDLTLNQVCSIMLDSQRKSWPEALKHVPTRKLYDFRMKALENRVRKGMTEQEISQDRHNQPRESFSSAEVNDYSNSARAKLRDRWNK